MTNDATGLHNIIEERRWDLALENVRYWDLLRQGLDVTKAALDVAQMYPVTFRPETEGLFEIPET